MMGGSKPNAALPPPSLGLSGLLGGLQPASVGQAQAQQNAMSGILGTADFTKTLSQLNVTVVSMQAELSVMQAALRDMGGHQSMLLGYIHYLNPDNGERPADPMNYAEWSRLQQVSDVINNAKAQAGEVV
jgi:hypothetical protein